MVVGCFDDLVVLEEVIPLDTGRVDVELEAVCVKCVFGFLVCHVGDGD